MSKSIGQTRTHTHTNRLHQRYPQEAFDRLEGSKGIGDYQNHARRNLVGSIICDVANYWLLVSEPGFLVRRTKSLKKIVFKAFRGLRTVPGS